MGDLNTQQLVNAFGIVRTVASSNDKTTSTAGVGLKTYNNLPQSKKDEINNQTYTVGEKAIEDVEYVLNGQSSDLMLYNSVYSVSKKANDLRN